MRAVFASSEVFTYRRAMCPRNKIKTIDTKGTKMAMDYFNNTLNSFSKPDDRFDYEDRLRKEREDFEYARHEEQMRNDAAYGMMFMAPKGPGL